MSPTKTHSDGRALALSTVALRVRVEHETIRRLLDDVERASTATKKRRSGGLDQLHQSVWNLYVAFDDHLHFEERELAPLLATAAASEDASRTMILEHNEQRAALLALVEDSESDAREPEALADEAMDVLVRFRIDMLREERLLNSVGPATSSAWLR